MVINNKREMRFAQVCVSLTLICLAGLLHFLGNQAYEAALDGNTRILLETALFTTGVIFIFYGNLVYQFCLVTHYRRQDEHRPATREALDAMYDKPAPALSIIIPSYKEERSVNWQTMLSAALAEYPHKNVVLLIDDPYQPKVLEDIVRLEETRKIPATLQALFDAPHARYRAEQVAFLERAQSGKLDHEAELTRLAEHYMGVAQWLENLAADMADGKERAALTHNDRFFIEAILEAPAKQHRAFVEKLQYRMLMGETPRDTFYRRYYARLISLFSVTFASFERKKYANLSHEANKAMNLNSYMGLIGKSWKEVETTHGLMIEECAADEADFTIPHADYVDTIDADSLMLSEYAIRLIHFMEQPGNERIAVAQSPCSSVPDSPIALERIAGACIDVQYRTHQGYTGWGASYWVGANAMLRRTALEDIRETRYENGHPVYIYIQDHTVIEDTESSIDLVHKGWKLYNYPERMTFSPTPPDFGSLLIQRRRWANGGALILPKLLHYAWHAPKTPALFKELFMRFYYLAGTTSCCVAALIFFFYPFGATFSTPWLPLSVVPVMALFARDLKNTGYHYSDFFRVCALNLMLVPVLIGGVLKQFQQGITGKKIPFSRTPKVPGRTAAPALYCLIELLIPFALVATAVHSANEGRMTQAVFSLLNAGLFAYALVYFMGLPSTFEDLLAGVRGRWRAAFHKAEIIPLPGMQEVPVPVQVTSKRA